MNVDPRQNDPQYQSPLESDSQRTSQFGMGSQADAPLQQDAQDMGPGGRFIDPKTIQPGAEVFGTDGKRVGTVQEVYEDSFMVQKGIFFVHDYFIPLSYVTRVAGDRIDLGLRSDEAKNQDWSRRPEVSALDRGVQANPATDNQQGSDRYGGGNLASDSNRTNGVSGDPYQSPALPADAVAGPGTGAGQAITPDQGASGQDSGDGQTSTSGDTPAYGNMPSATTPMQQQMPASGAAGRAGGADALQGANERGMQGTPDASSDSLSGAPREPRNPDDWDPTHQGMTNP